MKYLTTVLLISVLTGGLGMMTPAMATEHGKQGMGMKMMHGKGHGMGHDGCWKSSLTDVQKKQVAKLKLDFKKKVYPIKSKIRQAKVELALLVTADKPNQKDIDKKIDEIVKIKSEKIRLKVAHKIEVRKILNEEQRVQFDMKMLKKAFHGKKGGHHGRH